VGLCGTLWDRLAATSDENHPWDGRYHQDLSAGVEETGMLKLVDGRSMQQGSRVDGRARRTQQTCRLNLAGGALRTPSTFSLAGCQQQRRMQ
jgi:hypothetical protein